jgi:hypothetical protein
MEGVRRPPGQACDRRGPAVHAAYGVRRDGELYLCRTADRFWARLAGKDVLAPQPAEGTRHDR